MEINLLDELKIEHTVENFIKADKRYKSLLNTYILRSAFINFSTSPKEL